MIFFFISRAASFQNKSELPLGITPGAIFYINYGYIEGSSPDIEYYDNISKSINSPVHYIIWRASFCPMETGTYEFKFDFKGNAWQAWKDSSSGMADIGSTMGSCAGIGYWTSATFTSQQLSKGKCYPIRLDLCHGSQNGENIQRLWYRLVGTNTWYYEGDYIRENDQERCRQWYYGQTCERCTIDCSGNGICGGGTAQENKPDKCTCSSFADNPFCENPNKEYSFTGFSKGVQLQEISKNNDIESTTILNSASVDKISGSYTKQKMTFYLYCPQKSIYKIRATSNRKVVLEVKSEQAGSLNEIFECKESTTIQQIESKAFSADHELVKVVASFESGCGLYDHYLNVEWMFNRLYNEQNLTPQWSSIPTRYLFYQ